RPIRVRLTPRVSAILQPVQSMPRWDPKSVDWDRYGRIIDMMIKAVDESIAANPSDTIEQRIDRLLDGSTIAVVTARQLTAKIIDPARRRDWKSDRDV